MGPYKPLQYVIGLMTIPYYMEIMGVWTLAQVEVSHLLT